MSMITADKIVGLGKDVMSAVDGGREAKFAKLRLSSAFAELRDRTAAADAACRLFDDMKASGKFAKIVSGTVTVVENGVETIREKKYDPSANARGVIQKSVNTAYPSYEDTFVLKTHKSLRAQADYKPKTANDKLAMAVDKMFDLLGLTSAEETSLRLGISQAAKNAAWEEALIVNEARNERAVADAKKAAEAKKASAAMMAEATVRAKTALAHMGLKGAALKTAVPVLSETIYEAMQMTSEYPQSLLEQTS